MRWVFTIKWPKISTLKLVGVACHIGSQLQELDPFEQSVKEIMQLVRKIEANGIDIERVDCGGGLGISYSGENLPHIQELVAIMKKEILSKYFIAIEPGRSIVGNSGVLLTKIEYIKPVQKKILRL